MKQSKVKQILTVGCVVAAIALAALPLADLLVADSQITPQEAPVQTPVVVNADDDSVSALMTGSVVGRSRGASFGLRRPASAFVP